MRKIQMVELQAQLDPIRTDIDKAIAAVLDKGNFIQGNEVAQFEKELSQYLNCKHVISCGNGTDALQIALMALELQKGDEVIIPAFTYAAVIEVILLLGLVPVLVDVNCLTFNISVDQITNAITPKTKAIIPVHLFGQMSDMDAIMKLAVDYNLWVIEDNAQSLGARYVNKNRLSGTIGHIGCTSFFPTKNLGCMGDGGAINTDDDALAERIRMIGKHGQKEKYHHEILGINSRLDTIQAAILSVKLKRLDEQISLRQKVAERYEQHLSGLDQINIPVRTQYSTHTYHQYTIRVKEKTRDSLKSYLSDRDIPSMIYYPLPLSQQIAYKQEYKPGGKLSEADKLCGEVLSLPMHPYLDEEQLNYICSFIRDFFNA